MTTTDLTTQLAKVMFASNAGPGWGGVSKSVREIYIRAADTVIAHLTAAGRLIPAGGMALTAEQVEDVRTVVSADAAAWNRLSPALFAAYRLRRALLPAPEPAEEGGRIINGLADSRESHTLTAEEFADLHNAIWEGRGDYSSRDRLREKFPIDMPGADAPTKPEFTECCGTWVGDPDPTCSECGINCATPAPTGSTEKPRIHTPPHHNPVTGTTRITVQRACNRCSRDLGDATEKELDACVNGTPLPAVHDECGCDASLVAPAEEDTKAVRTDHRTRPSMPSNPRPSK